MNKFDVNIDVEVYAADQMSRIRCAFGIFYLWIFQVTCCLFSLLGKTSHLQCIEFPTKFVFESLCANKKIVLVNMESILSTLYVKMN